MPYYQATFNGGTVPNATTFSSTVTFSVSPTFSNDLNLGAGSMMVWSASSTLRGANNVLRWTKSDGSQFTVATLPAAATAGANARAMVTDATTTTFGGALTGGGANIVPVFCTGAAWLIG